MSYFRAVYHLSAGIAFAVWFNDVAILRWHGWETSYLGISGSGFAIGLFETGICALLSFYSFCKAAEILLADMKLGKFPSLQKA